MYLVSGTEARFGSKFCSSDLGMAPGGSPGLIECSKVLSKSASFERVEARLPGTLA